ncbi:hypothetical protein [Paracoccus methylarcula]|uniref:Uncharacterized protein n=1 Tax=Paracoccus methylarcula TaxID=72022 RepID=A0A3R7PPH5_9RHOB|nr:hypothetical protein [Paracoccus methylarcula]RNF34350.1 hypothetical protein A7A09_010605 [Paracoccus methylarcula]
MTFGPEIELLVRIAATAAIVIGVTLAAEHLGPKIGGALAGLPIVIGPAFFFLIREQSQAFSADAAAASLTSLAATQAFLLGYVAVAARSRAAIGAAIFAWVISALLLSLLPASPWMGLLIFTLSMLAVRRLAVHFVRPHGVARAKGTYMLLILRGLAAGLLVGVVTFAADRLGPVWAGFLIAYPIGLTVISVTIHQRLGAEIAISTLHAIMLGISSLAAFSFVLSVTLSSLGPSLAFTAALVAGVLVTVLLVLVSARREAVISSTR